jgi:hypothetical protein
MMMCAGHTIDTDEGGSSGGGARGGPLHAAERGSALLLAITATVLMLVFGAALVLVTTTETRIASRFAGGVETLYAAEAVLDRALLDLFALQDWDAALTGAATSTFADGPPAGRRTIGDTTIDVEALTNQLRCGRPACGAAEIAAVTAARPWGHNNPRWQLFAWGPVSALAPALQARDVYVLVWVGDDPGETDGDPLRDAAAEDRPGGWTLSLAAQAVGPGGLRRMLEATVTRTTPVPPPEAGGPLPPPAAAGPGPSRVLAWREVR